MNAFVFVFLFFILWGGSKSYVVSRDTHGNVIPMITIIMMMDHEREALMMHSTHVDDAELMVN